MSVPNSSVLWSVPQSLTEPQKLQGRSNIDAAKVKFTTTAIPPVDTGVSTLQIYTDGRVRGDNSEIGCIAPKVSQSDSGKILVANWSGSPGIGKATWQPMPDVTPWGVNTNTSVSFIEHPQSDDPNRDIPYSILVNGIQNYKNNIVNISIPNDTQVPWCSDDFVVIRINTPAIVNPNDAFGFNYWIRLAISRNFEYGSQRSSFEIDIPNVGSEIDQYSLVETDTVHTLSTKRMKIVNSDEGYTQSTPYKIGEQQVGPSSTPNTATMNHYSTVEPVVLDYHEDFTINTGKAVFESELHSLSYQQMNDFSTNIAYKSVRVPEYGYTNFYMIKVTGDMFKVSRFQPHA